MMASSTNMSDEDRLALAAKLDRELDDFIDGLEKKRYADGWPEDRWEEEMDKHPFFMKQAPNATDTLSPLAEGLQRLKYDPDDNTPEELAVSYKDDGNFNFKHKNYRLAIIGYTEGIKQKCEDKEVNASLYNNRSASHFFLGNYRSSLLDSKKALSFKPDYHKCLVRAAECALKLSEFETCFEYCNEIIERNFDNSSALRIKREAEQNKVIADRNKRKQEYKNKKQSAQEHQILSAIKSRGIKLENNDSLDNLSLADLEPSFPAIADCRVHFSPSGEELVWPVLLLYPEYKLTEFIQNCSETSLLKENLAEMFASTPEWDSEGTYKLENLNLYYEGTKKFTLFKVDLLKSLLDTMKEDYFELRSGTPAFIVLVKDSIVEKSFLKSCK